MAEVSLTLTTVAAYSMWVLYVLFIEWVSVYLSLSLFFFCLFPLPSDLGQSIFYTTTCLLPFLSDDILSTLPYTMISTLATFPPFLHKDIIEYLSTSFLPMAICEYDLIWSNQVIKHLCGLYKPLQSASLNSTWKEALEFVPVLISLLLACLQWAPQGEREESQPMSICLPPLCLWSPCSTPQIQASAHSDCLWSMHANLTHVIMLWSYSFFALLPSSISLSIVGVSNEAQTGSVEGISHPLTPNVDMLFVLCVMHNGRHLWHRLEGFATLMCSELSLAFWGIFILALLMLEEISTALTSYSARTRRWLAWLSRDTTKGACPVWS